MGSQVGIEGNEEIVINCARGPENAVTMTGDFQRESGFWFKKPKGEDDKGPAEDKFVDFTLMANSMKKQKVQVNVAQFEGQRAAKHEVNFDKCGITMNILVTVLDHDAFHKVEEEVRKEPSGGCCTIF